MNKSFRSLLSVLLILATTATLSVSRPIWRFTILAAVSRPTAFYYGGSGDSVQLATMTKLIMEQMRTVNERFNQNNPFQATFDFVVDSVYIFDGNPLVEIDRSHPRQHYKVVYDGFPTQGGGWYGHPLNVIHHSWPVAEHGGPFDSFATDGIVHEFGHARGAIDLYKLAVVATNNHVNDEPYTPGISIMNYPYGVRIWDQHSVALINRNADTIYTSLRYITEAFPPEFRIMITRDALPAIGARFAIYPVSWDSGTVWRNEIALGQIGASGAAATIGINPFYPNTAGKPWNIRYHNLLLEATQGGDTAYRWLPLDSVQIHAFAQPGAAYTITINLGSISSLSGEQRSKIDVELSQNYPNPASGNTKIDYTLATAEHVTLTIHSVDGERMVTIIDQDQQPGLNSVGFDARALPPGTYYYGITAGKWTETRVLSVVR